MGEATHFPSKTICIKKRGTFSLFSLFLSLFFLVKLLFPKTALLLKMAPLVTESLQTCQLRESTYWCISGTTFREWRETVGSHYVYGFLTVPNFLHPGCSIHNAWQSFRKTDESMILSYLSLSPNVLKLPSITWTSRVFRLYTSLAVLSLSLRCPQRFRFPTWLWNV